MRNSRWKTGSHGFDDRRIGHAGKRRTCRADAWWWWWSAARRWWWSAALRRRGWSATLRGWWSATLRGWWSAALRGWWSAARRGWWSATRRRRESCLPRGARSTQLRAACQRPFVYTARGQPLVHTAYWHRTANFANVHRGTTVNHSVLRAQRLQRLTHGNITTNNATR